MNGQESTGNALYGTSADDDSIITAFTSGAIPIAVYGLGKMGLPLAATYADVSKNVTGVDIDPAVVDSVNDGVCHVEGEPGLDRLVSSVVDDGYLRASTDIDRVAASSSVHVVIVPTTLTDENEPDLRALRSVVASIGDGLTAGDLVILESTVPPGTSRTLVLPMLEHRSGLELGSFGLAFCPERTSSGRALQDIQGAYPKIVGGADRESTRIAELIYGCITSNDVYAVSDIAVAEAVKVFEGVYRDVNIALANELATLSGDLDIDVREAINAANTQPFCDIHDPGPGVGGHCIPYYPWFVISAVDMPTPLLEAARSVNQSIPAYTADLLTSLLAEHDVSVEQSTIVLFGVTYRPGVAEIRESPTFPIATAMTDAGATVYVVDPMLDETTEIDAVWTTLDQLDALDIDAAVMVTPHREFDDVDWTALDARVVLDGRNTLGDVHGKHVLGVH